ncbi:MAG: 16S rRNA (cytidine(1402)-2'-O)-methyltransferase [Paludibacteraceae bacterium]|nr:16S rRNA (cytidine(1402)-2'-O)-methyltransferase [Paludibacteraceae bacterium]
MLYVVPTPVGNLEDITLRALRVLKEVDVVLAEDTRTSSILFKHYDIHTPLQSYHKFNEHQTVEKLCEQLLSGVNMALISDAGTPSISDPGFLLIRACVERDIEVVCLPGSTAFVPALVNSGLPINEFAFYGFLPLKKGRNTMLQTLAQEQKTFVLYESPFRLVKTLQALATTLGKQRKASVSREISKIHEETKRGTLEELENYYTNNPPKGEIVIVVEGSD